jgi:hypothetical protein
MALTPGQRPRTTWKDAAAVPHRQGLPLGRGDHSGAAAHIKGSAGGAAQDRGELGQHGSQESIQARPRGVLEGAVGVVVRVAELAADDHPSDGGVTGESSAGLRF